MEGYLGVQDKAGEARVNSKIKIKIKALLPQVGRRAFCVSYLV